MATRRIGIIMHGATSRIGTTQHLLNSLLPIRAEGGLPLANGDRLCPTRSWSAAAPTSSRRWPPRLGVERWTTDLDAALADPGDEVFFECAFGGGRVDLAKRALAAGKHIYLREAGRRDLAEVLDLRAAAEAAGRKHAVYAGQDPPARAGEAEDRSLGLGTLGQVAVDEAGIRLVGL